jgi:hypothetical protein
MFLYVPRVLKPSAEFCLPVLAMLIMMEVILMNNTVVGICCHSFAVNVFFKVAIVIYRVFRDLCLNLREKCFVVMGWIVNSCGQGKRKLRCKYYK